MLRRDPRDPANPLAFTTSLTDDEKEARLNYLAAAIRIAMNASDMELERPYPLIARHIMQVGDDLMASLQVRSVVPNLSLNRDDIGLLSESYHKTMPEGDHRQQQRVGATLFSLDAKEICMAFALAKRMNAAEANQP